MKIVGNKKASAKSSGSRIWRAVAWEYASATSTVVSRIAAKDSAIGRINTSRGLFMIRPAPRAMAPRGRQDHQPVSLIFAPLALQHRQTLGPNDLDCTWGNGQISVIAQPS